MFQSIIIAVAIIASLAAIVAVLKLIAKRQAQAKKDAMRQTYHALVAQNNLEPELVEVFRHRMFALDATQKQFLFIEEEGAKDHRIVDLKAQRECRVMNSGHSISTTRKSGQTQTEEHINAISLVFTSADGSQVAVPVYTEAQDGIEERQQLKAKASKWQGILEALIREIRVRA
jgi:hypothetical protein